MSSRQSSYRTILAELSWKVFAVGFFGSVSAAGYGFDQGWWAGAISFSEFNSVFGSYNAATDSWALSATQQSLGTGLGILAAVIGLGLGRELADRFGRCKSFLVQSILLLAGVIIESTTISSYAQMIVGRFIVYISGGIATTVVPVYMAECAPPTLRGLMATTYNGALMLGAFVSSLILYLCRNVHSHWSWRGVIVAQIGTPILCLLGLLVIPESPRWLIVQGRRADAVSALVSLRGDKIDAESEIKQLENQVRTDQANDASPYFDCFRGTNLRRTIIVAGTQVAQQTLGISLIGNYLGVFLVSIGFTNTLLIVMVTYIIGIVATVVTMLTIDVTGRRKMLLYPALLLAVLMFIVAVLTRNGAVGVTKSEQNAAVAMLLIWFAVFQVTWGPGAWIVTAEIPGSAVRAKSVTIAGIFSYGVNCAITFVNPYVVDAINGKLGFIFGSFSILAAAFVFFVVPEVKQRSLVEIDELFEKRVPTREFPNYVCEASTTSIVEKDGSRVSRETV